MVRPQGLDGALVVLTVEAGCGLHQRPVCFWDVEAPQSLFVGLAEQGETPQRPAEFAVIAGMSDSLTHQLGGVVIAAGLRPKRREVSTLGVVEYLQIQFLDAAET